MAYNCSPGQKITSYPCSLTLLHREFSLALSLPRTQRLPAPMLGPSISKMLFTPLSIPNFGDQYENPKFLTLYYRDQFCSSVKNLCNYTTPKKPCVLELKTAHSSIFLNKDIFFSPPKRNSAASNLP